MYYIMMYIYTLKFHIALIIKMSESKEVQYAVGKEKSPHTINEKLWKTEESCHEV